MTRPRWRQLALRLAPLGLIGLLGLPGPLGSPAGYAAPPHPVGPLAPPGPPTGAADATREALLASRFDALMGAIDTLPRDAAELSAWLPDARTRLARAAADPSGATTTWVRIRSLQLLTRFADALPEVLARTADRDPDVRAAAIYALARVYATTTRRDQAAIARAVTVGLADADADVRASSARALRWLVAPRTR